MSRGMKYTKGTECHGRPIVQIQSADHHRVDDSPLSATTPAEPWGWPSIKQKSSALQICIPDTRPTSVADKCNGHKLEGPVYVHIPYLDHSWSSTDTITGGTSRNYSHCIILGRQTGLHYYWNYKIDQSIKLPLLKNLLCQSHSGVAHNNLGLLNLHAWWLSGDPFSNKVVPLQWQPG